MNCKFGTTGKDYWHVFCSRGTSTSQGVMWSSPIRVSGTTEIPRDSHSPRNRWLECFLLARPVKSVARCSARHPGRGDLLSMIEEAMRTTPIVFILIILLFGFDSTGEVTNSPATQSRLRRSWSAEIRARNLKSSEISIFENLRNN
jgi:hypothetical protein